MRQSLQQLLALYSLFHQTSHSGRSQAAPGGKSASMHSAAHQSPTRSKLHANSSSFGDLRQRYAGWALWSTAGAFYGLNQSLQPSSVEPNMDVTRSMSEHATYTHDVPWDAVHRYPPAVRGYEYASGCRSQNLTVARRGGKLQRVNIVRCY